MAGFVQKLDHRLHIRRGPSLSHQVLARLGRVLGFADQGDDAVDVGDGDGEPGQHMGFFPRFSEFEYGAPADHLFSEFDEGGDELLQVQHLRLAHVQGQHVDAETGLQGREPEQLRQNHLGFGVALQLDNDADAVAVGFVTQVGNALDPFVAYGLGHDLDHAGLVHLIRDFVNDDCLAALSDLLERGLGAHDHRTAAGVIGLQNPRAAHDQPAGREIRPRDMVFDDLFDGNFGVFDIGATRANDLAQVMGRNVGRHADGDTTGAVD